MGNKASTDEPNVDAPHEREAPGLTGLCCNGRDYEKETANLRIYFFLVYMTFLRPTPNSHPKVPSRIPNLPPPFAHAFYSVLSTLLLPPLTMSSCVSVSVSGVSR